MPQPTDPRPHRAGDVVEAVLRTVELVPRGRVVSYGDIAELVGTGPRRVGWIMAHYGAQVPWWRVTDVRGRLGPLAQALPHWAREGIALNSSGTGCRFAKHHADLMAWADSAERAGVVPRER